VVPPGMDDTLHTHVASVGRRGLLQLHGGTPGIKRRHLQQRAELPAPFSSAHHVLQCWGGRHAEQAWSVLGVYVCGRRGAPRPSPV
jgi:hypothetical protein